MNVNFSGMIPFQPGQMPKNFGAVSTKGSSFMNLLGSLMTENVPGAVMTSAATENPEVSGADENLLEVIVGQGINLNSIKSEAMTDAYEQPGLKKIETINQDQDKDDEDSTLVLDGINQYLAYVPKFQNDNYEVLKADDSVKSLNDLINQSKPRQISTFENLKAQDKQIPASEKISPDAPKAEGLKEINTYAKKIISEIENSRSKLKNEIDLNANLAEKSRAMLSENKIIEVSDESSYIKSSAISQIKEKVELLVKDGTNGTKEVTMELQPEHLGKVHIKMFYENNKLTVEIKALNEETSKLLQSNSQELAKVLNKTVDSSVNVVVKHESAYGQNPLDYSQEQGKNQQKNNYTYKGFNQDENDDDMFSQIMNGTAS
nr:flagellar hook-length control protein FliK [Sedimentibacter sp.]